MEDPGLAFMCELWSNSSKSTSHPPTTDFCSKLLCLFFVFFFCFLFLFFFFFFFLFSCLVFFFFCFFFCLPRAFSPWGVPAPQARGVPRSCAPWLLHGRPSPVLAQVRGVVGQGKGATRKKGQRGRGKTRWELPVGCVGLSPSHVRSEKTK